jgi:hypothetical protein
MTEVVYKYQIGEQDSLVEMKAGARLLHAAVQNGKVCLWAAVDPKAADVKRRILLVGTGHAVPELGRHVATFMTSGGVYVWHVFDLGVVPTSGFTKSPPAAK